MPVPTPPPSEPEHRLNQIEELIKRKHPKAAKDAELACLLNVLRDSLRTY